MFNTHFTVLKSLLLRGENVAAAEYAADHDLAYPVAHLFGRLEARRYRRQLQLDGLLAWRDVCNPRLPEEHRAARRERRLRRWMSRLDSLVGCTLSVSF